MTSRWRLGSRATARSHAVRGPCAGCVLVGEREDRRQVDLRLPARRPCQQQFNTVLVRSPRSPDRPRRSPPVPADPAADTGPLTLPENRAPSTVRAPTPPAARFEHRQHRPPQASPPTRRQFHPINPAARWFARAAQTAGTPSSSVMAVVLGCRSINIRHHPIEGCGEEAPS